MRTSATIGWFWFPILACCRSCTGRSFGMATDVAKIAARGDGKRAYVQQIFSEIAPRYDLLNHLLSFNVDRLEATWTSVRARSMSERRSSANAISPASSSVRTSRCQC